MDITDSAQYKELSDNQKQLQKTNLDYLHSMAEASRKAK